MLIERIFSLYYDIVKSNVEYFICWLCESLKKVKKIAENYVFNIFLTKKYRFRAEDGDKVFPWKKRDFPYWPHEPFSKE